MFRFAISPLRVHGRAPITSFMLSLVLALASPLAESAAPTISGTPGVAAFVGNNYYFKPTAADADGGRLRFSITGKPSWLSFSKSNGSIWGTPRTANVGTYSGIQISVTDGTSTARLPSFSITVSTASSVVNRAPSISGSPVTTAQVGQPYAWQPTASDADGDTLGFSIANRPAWASFDTTNGTLYGTPSSIGSFADIVIRANDGQVTSSLPAFTITVSSTASRTVTLRWTAPTRNVDGTSLTNLAGYTVFYGNGSRSYQQTLPVGSSATSAAIEGLGSGRWYFAIKSRNTAGAESDYSSEASVTL